MNLSETLLISHILHPLSFILNMSVSKANIKLVRSLQQKKFRDERGLFVAEGRKCVEELSKAFERVMLFVEGENATAQEMGRFYRHVLIEKNFPHHGAVAFGHFGKALYEVFKYIGVPIEDLDYNQPAGVRYPTENRR